MIKIIIILVVGAGVGLFLKSRLDSRFHGNDRKGRGDDIVNNPNAEKIVQKQENLEKVLGLARSRGEIANDDVEQALSVSDATAERYLQELEEQGKLEQIGGAGGPMRHQLT